MTKNRLILALQCCPHDVDIAARLVALICHIEQEVRYDVGFAIIARRDTDHEKLQRMVSLAYTKFGDVQLIMGTRFGTGWPMGCNDLWQETMMRLSMGKSLSFHQANGVLTFEADCVPMRTDWIDVLKAAWDQTVASGKECCGHVENLDPPHINGNGIFAVDITFRHKELAMSSASQGWDTYHQHLLMSIGQDTEAIYQIYGKPVPSYQAFCAIRKNGKVPALFHGIKGMDGINMVREMMADGIFCKPSDPGLFQFQREAQQNDDTAIFIRSYAKDIPWLEYLLRSIEKFADGFKEVVIVCPVDEAPQMRPLCNKFPRFKLMTWGPMCKDGYIDQQITKMNADDYTDCHYILHLDSDCFIQEPITPAMFRMDLKPQLLYRFWEEAGEAQCWKAPTDSILGFPTTKETMLRMPIMHDRRVYRGLRDLIQHRTGAPANYTVASMAKFSEFNALGNFALAYMPGDYFAVHRDNEPKSPISQGWSWGGLSEDRAAAMELVLNPVPAFGPDDLQTQEKPAGEAPGASPVAPIDDTYHKPGVEGVLQLSASESFRRDVLGEVPDSIIPKPETETTAA